MEQQGSSTIRREVAMLYHSAIDDMRNYETVEIREQEQELPNGSTGQEIEIIMPVIPSSENNTKPTGSVVSMRLVLAIFILNVLISVVACVLTGVIVRLLPMDSQQKKTVVIGNQETNFNESLHILGENLNRSIADHWEIVNTAISDLVHRFNTMENDVAVIATKQDQLTDELHGQASFVAYMAANETIDANAIIKYSNLPVNIGDVYNITDGTFMAPFPGTYIFSTQLCCQRDCTVDYQMVVNSTVHASTQQCYGDGESVCSSLTTVSLLNEGEEVWVQNGNYSFETGLNKGETHYQNTFSGFLIHRSIN